MSIADLSSSIADPALPPPPSDSLWHISLERYHEMIRKGILTTDDPVELWEGVLVEKMPKNRPHCLTTELVRDALAAVLNGGWHVESQESITLARSELEPDVVVLRGTKRDYVETNPSPSDLALVVEVADSTLSRDRGFKKALYARTRIPIYWIVNLVDRQVEVYWSAGEAGGKADYLSRKVFAIGDRVPLTIAGEEVARIAVLDVLP